MPRTLCPLLEETGQCLLSKKSSSTTPRQPTSDAEESTWDDERALREYRLKSFRSTTYYMFIFLFSKGHSQGYPSAAAPSQPVAQSVDVQGYPSNQDTGQFHNQPLDSVTALANEFGRQSISNPSGVSSDGRLPPPPPLHPSRRTSSASLKPSSPSGVSSGGKLPPPPLHPDHPDHPDRLPSSSLKPSRSRSQTGHHHVAPPVSSSLTLTPAASTNRHRWPPAEWDSDTPPVQQPHFSGRTPSPKVISELLWHDLKRWELLQIILSEATTNSFNQLQPFSKTFRSQLPSTYPLISILVVLGLHHGYRVILSKVDEPECQNYDFVRSDSSL